MSEIVCKECGCIEMRREVKGPHLGVYCSGCGKWQKWEKHAEKDKTPEQYKDEYLSKQPATKEQVSYIRFLLQKDFDKAAAIKIIEILKQEEL